jgi:OFA family oxalate/formate antiporter-like MFS transporter
MLLDSLYYLLALVCVAGATSGLVIIAHASPVLHTVANFTPIAAGSWVGILAISNYCGRIGWGFISDKIGRMPSIIIIYTFLGTARSWLASISYNIVAPILIVGACFGGFMGMIASITADAFGPKYLPVNFGVMFLPFGIAAFIGPRLAAVIKVSSGSYSQAFLIASVLGFVGIGLAIVGNINLRQRKQGVLPMLSAQRI